MGVDLIWAAVPYVIEQTFSTLLFLKVLTHSKEPITATLLVNLLRFLLGFQGYYFDISIELDMPSALRSVVQQSVSLGIQNYKNVTLTKH